MKTKTKKEPKVHPFTRIQEWSLISKGLVKAIYINPTWGITLYDGMSLDIEHDGDGNFVGLGIYDPKLNVCYYWTELWQSLQLPRFIAHNGASDLFYLKQWGFKVDESYLLYDTMLMSHILDSSRKMYGLKALAKADLGVEWPSYTDIVGKKGEKTLLEFPTEAVGEYNSCDSYYCYQLFLRQLEVLNVL